MKCGVGAVIPDRLYRKGMENKAVDTLLLIYPKLADYLGRENMLLLAALQSVHDENYIDLWRTKLLDVATKFDLSGKVLREVAA